MSGIILDTHIWIWLMEGDTHLSPKMQKTINEAAKESFIGVAAISIWEVAMLAKKGRIKLFSPVSTWIKEALSFSGLTLLPLSPEVAVESTSLGDAFHGDPADQMIVATARVHRLTLLTRDEKILAYGKKGNVLLL